MFYFVGNNIGHKTAGIEKAMINRLNLFKAYHYQAKILLLAWNRYLTQTASQYINSEDYVNMYDYFQEASNVTSVFSKNWLHYWRNECGYTIKPVSETNDVRIYDQQQFIMYAHFADEAYQKIDYINYFDTSRRKIKRELYDTRGFLSCVRVLSTDQKIQAEYYLSPQGNVKIEKYYDINSNHPYEAKKIILNHLGKTHFLNNETELGAFFIETIYQNSDLFFSDRNLATSHIFNIVASYIPVIAVLHSTHVKDVTDLAHSPIKNVYKGVFEHLQRYKAIIVSTQQQKADVIERISGVIPVYAIPVGYSSIDMKDYSNENKYVSPKKIISVARYSPEKQLMQQIELINKLKDAFPNIELHMYGFGKEEQHLKERIQELGLEKHVILRGFLKDLTDEYQDAYLNLITSNMEGFSLALLECESHGVPSISYDIQYGPGELIQDGKNGYLVEKNNQHMLFEKVKLLLNNPQLQQSFSHHCIETAQKYSRTQIMLLWKNLLQHFN